VSRLIICAKILFDNFGTFAGINSPPLLRFAKQNDGGSFKGGSMVERSEFKGKPLIVLKRGEDEKFPFSFGVSKAKMILENIEEIKKFVAENSAE
jgi:hypothetical protein